MCIFSSCIPYCTVYWKICCSEVNLPRVKAIMVSLKFQISVEEKSQCSPPLCSLNPVIGQWSSQSFLSSPHSTFNSKPGEVGAAVEAALRAGYRLIDCALIYENEAEIGEALQKCFKEGVVKREEVFITSKLWYRFVCFIC